MALVGFRASSSRDARGVGDHSVHQTLKLRSREKALRALLHRHPEPTVDDESFLVSLRVPVTWIHQAKASRLASAGDAFAQYHELLLGGLYDHAHRILVDSLAPEAVLREDMALLRRLCEPLGKFKPDGWEYSGKVSDACLYRAEYDQLFLDYAALVEETPRLLSSVIRAGGRPDPHEASTLTTLALSLPRVLQLLPDKEDVQQVAGLSDMLSSLHQIAGHLHRAQYVSSQLFVRWR